MTKPTKQHMYPVKTDQTLSLNRYLAVRMKKVWTLYSLWFVCTVSAVENIIKAYDVPLLFANTFFHGLAHIRALYSM